MPSAGSRPPDQPDYPRTSRAECHLLVRAQPEQRVVERRDQISRDSASSASTSVRRTASSRRRPRPVAVDERTQRAQQLGPLARALAEQHGSTHRGRPGAVLAAEEEHERLAQLVRPQPSPMEEGDLEALEGLRQIVASAGRSGTGADLAASRPETIEPRGSPVGS